MTPDRLRVRHDDPPLKPQTRVAAVLRSDREPGGLVDVYVYEIGHETYRRAEEGVRVGNMLAMVEGEDAQAVLET